MPDTQTARTLREERAKIGNSITEILKKANSEDRVLSGEERGQIDTLEASLAEATSKVEQAERLEEITRDLNEEVRTPDGGYVVAGGQVQHRAPADRDNILTRRDMDLAMRAWGLQGLASAHFLDAASKCGLDVNAGHSAPRLADSFQYRKIQNQFRREGLVYRATTFQSKGTAGAGGHTVPDETASSIEEALLYYGGMREAGTVIRTATGVNLSLPTADDTANAGTILGENTAASVSDLAFAEKTYGAFKLSSGIVRSSIELLQDTGVDLIGYIGRALGTRLARGANRYFSTGSTATTSPRGIIRDSVAGFSATTASGDISLTSLTELFYSVDREYRDQPGAGWMMSDGIIKECRLVVDSNGQPLWGPGLRGGEPDTLLGKPVYANNRLTASSTGSGANLAWFGDLSKYIIREVMDMELRRFDERYGEYLQVGWLAVLRTDGGLLTASTRAASKPVKHLVGTT